VRADQTEQGTPCTGGHAALAPPERHHDRDHRRDRDRYRHRRERPHPLLSPGRGLRMNLSRLEAFSDGVLAVAITLLVLDLHVTPDSSLSLVAQLGAEWPSFAAYGISFFVIGVIWVNHHALIGLAARVDRGLMFYNLLLL